MQNLYRRRFTRFSFPCFLLLQSFAKDSMSHMSSTLETVQEHTRAAIGQTQQLSAGLRQACTRAFA